MRRFYQESWQGIPFSSFTHVAFFHLAGPKFYATFYEELFRRFASWNDLPREWRINKSKDARWLAEQIVAQRSAWEAEGGDAPSRVLSIGSGVGFMEKMLLDVLPDLELHVNEPSTVGMRWLRQCVPTERIYIGLPPACLPSDVQYNVIYLSAVDYGIPTREFGHMLGELRAQLAPGGRLLCLSASLLEEDSLIGSLVNGFKIGIRGVLHYLGIRRQQFWGWRRTRAEYHELFRNAGFVNIQDGHLDDGFETYWIGGE
ncbi:MAG: class I SAM-dependent methyltransferase [Desulfovibrionaceae bacterium]|nr:class I SAM-dependent methyltransferase [Desulfovibrionaceae bacterium]